MILQALDAYYQRKTALDSTALPPLGCKRARVPFVIVLDARGRLVELEDTREAVGKNLVAKQYVVPYRSRQGLHAWKVANIAVDYPAFTLGLSEDTGKGAAVDSARKHGAFKALIGSLAQRFAEDAGLAAIGAFLARDDRGHGEWEKVTAHPTWAKVVALASPPLIGFKLKGSLSLVSDSDACRQAASEFVYLDAAFQDGEEAGIVEAICLVSGQTAQIARKHPETPIPGSKSNARLVSFQRGYGFDSYGKTQAFNAPVSVVASGAYAAALQYLSAPRSRQRVLLGEDTVVFWAEKASGESVEDAFAGWFDPPKDDPDDGAERVRALYAFKQGKSFTDDDSQRFFVLGLAPNAARVSVRFWYVATIREVGDRILKHFADLEIVQPLGPSRLPSMYWLLRSVAVLEDADNLPPNLAGDWMRAILAGGPYPQTLLQLAVRRFRVMRSKEKKALDLTHLRAAIIKACLNRSRSASEKEITVALDTQNTNAGYRLGRLFAVFERIQEEASPGINATIRDRYFGAASSSPLVAFPILNRLKMHHLRKIANRGRVVNLEKLIGEVVDGLDAQNPFPPHLPLADQGRFAVGYYHQRQKFFEKTGGDK